MIHIDTPLLLPLAASLVLLLWLSYCGAVLVRHASSIRDWTLLAPLGLATGCALFLVCANLIGKVGALPADSGIGLLIGRVGTSPLAFGVSFFTVSALGIFASVRQWPGSWQIPSRRSISSFSGYALLALVLTYVCLSVRNHAYFYDFPTHLAFASSIAQDNLPVRNPYAPVLPSGYHYGAALLVAALSRGANLPAVVGYQLLAALQGAALLLLVFALGREAGKHALWGLVSLFSALAMGSLVIWWPFAPTPPVLSALLLGEFSQDIFLQFPSLREYIEFVYPIVSFSTDLRWLLIYPHRLAGLLTVLALAVVLIGPGRRRWGLTCQALAVTVAAAIALYDETMLPLALMALAWPLLISRHSLQGLLGWSGCILAAVILIALQGGTITHALRESTDTSALLSVRGASNIVSSIVFVKTLPEGWVWILPPLPLAVYSLVFIWKRWWTGLMLCGFGFAGLIGFHTLAYQGAAGSGQFTRVVNLAFLMLAIVAPLAVARMSRDAQRWRTALVAILFLPLAIPTLVHPSASIFSDLGERVDLIHPETSGLVFTPQITDPRVTHRLFEYRSAYKEVAQRLPKGGVLLTQYPVSFLIATGRLAAFGSIEGQSTYPSHLYVAGPEFYDAFWRLDPASWRALGASAVLYHRESFNSLSPSARNLLENDGWFVRSYEDGRFSVFTASEAFLQYGPSPESSFSLLSERLSPSESLFLSLDLPFRIGQALVHQLRDRPTSGLGLDNRVQQWITLNRPASLAEADAKWHVRSHIESRLSGILPEAALWHWRSPGESVGVYPNATIPGFPLRKVAAGQSIMLTASERDLVVNGSPGQSSTARFRSLSVVLAGHPGSVVQLCGPTGCAQRDLTGGAWVIALPLGQDPAQYTIATIHGEALIAGTLGYTDPLSAVRTPGVVLQPRQAANTIEVDASYYNHQGWTLGDGMAWHIVKTDADNDEQGIWWASQLQINGERGDVRLTLDPSGILTESNFTTAPQVTVVDALTDGEYQAYLAFTIDPLGIVDRIPAARFTIEKGTIVAFTPLPQIAQLSYGTEHIEPISLEQ